MCVCPVQREPVPDDYSRVDPEHKLIYRFVRTLFSAAQLTAECAIVTLVSLSRFIAPWCTHSPVYCNDNSIIVGVLGLNRELNTGLFDCKR